jgi:hypothetical protein
MNRVTPPWILLLVTVILANILWCITFYLTFSTFWLKIAVSTALLAALSWWIRPIARRRLRLNGRALVIGLVSAAALYLIFWTGREISTALFPFAEHQIEGIYGKGAGTPRWIVFLLLLFVTGPCEEIYWRGFLQDSLMGRFGGGAGWLLTTVLYAGAHLWSFNFMLIGAAAVAGAFWGAMYWRIDNLLPVVISHALWSAVIFAVMPLA